MKWDVPKAAGAYFAINRILNESFLNREEKNILTRAIMGVANCSSKKAVMTKALEEFDEKFDDSSRKKEIKTLLTTLSTVFDTPSETLVKKVSLVEGDVVVKFEDTSIKIPLNFYHCKKDSKEVIVNRAILYFLEKSLAPQEGQSWTFGRKMLQRLFDRFKPVVEGFSDSQNHSLTTYMSLFSDYDSSPGCIGNFFTSTLRPTIYYVNPPYAPLVLTKAVKRMLLHLQSKRSYGFLVIVPFWEEEEFWQQLYHSRYNKYLEYIHFPTVYNGKKAFTANMTVTIFYLSNY